MKQNSDSCSASWNSWTHLGSLAQFQTICETFQECAYLPSRTQRRSSMPPIHHWVPWLPSCIVLPRAFGGRAADSRMAVLPWGLCTSREYGKASKRTKSGGGEGKSMEPDARHFTARWALSVLKSDFISFNFPFLSIAMCSWHKGHLACAASERWLPFLRHFFSPKRSKSVPFQNLFHKFFRGKPRNTAQGPWRPIREGWYCTAEANILL